MANELLLLGCGSGGAGGSAFIGVLDGYTSNLAGSWSVARRLLTSYTGNLFRVRRSSDSTEADIGFLANGSMDSATLLTFAGAGSAFVTTWYDQSGAALNLVQATAANQPRIVNSGALDTQNGHAAFFWDGTNDSIRSNWSGPTSYTAYTMAVLKAAGSFPMMVVLEAGFQELRGNAATGKLEVTDGGFVCTQAASSVDTWAQLSWKRVSGTSTRGWMNNTAFAAAASGNTRATTEVAIGVRPGSALFANMYASELFIYSAAHDDTTREALQTVQSSYYA